MLRLLGVKSDGTPRFSGDAPCPGETRGGEAAPGRGTSPGAGAPRPVSLGSSLLHNPSGVAWGVYKAITDGAVRSIECGWDAPTSDGTPDAYLAIRLNRRKLSIGSVEARRPSTVRGAVREFTPGASARLGLYAEECKAEYRYLGTLTVDREYSRDPADFRAAVDRFNTWFMRRQCSLCPSGQADVQSLLWWVEFQKRGAPHLHFFYTQVVPWQQAAAQWHAICLRYGLCLPDNSEFWRSATKFEKIRNGWRGVASYARKYATKSEQKEPDREVYDWQGRYWGVRGYKATEALVVSRSTSEYADHPSVYPSWVGLRELMEQAARDGNVYAAQWPDGGKGVTYYPRGGWSEHPELWSRICLLMPGMTEGLEPSSPVPPSSACSLT